MIIFKCGGLSVASDSGFWFFVVFVVVVVFLSILPSLRRQADFYSSEMNRNNPSHPPYSCEYCATKALSKLNN